jgi:guanylate kinase
MMDAPFQGRLFIFTAPSGAGKTTIVRHLLQTFSELEFSISATTRVKREHETDGKDYYFITPEQFRDYIKDNQFVEWEEVYQDQFYGTLKSEVDRIWSMRKHVVFDIDVKGAERIKMLFGKQCMSVFVRPPSEEILIERLIQRNTENEESLKKRIARVKSELQFENRFDMVLVNDALPVTLREAAHIIQTFIYGIPQS